MKEGQMDECLVNKASQERIHVSFHLYKNLEHASPSTATESRLWLFGEGRPGGNISSDGYVHYLRGGGGFPGLYLSNRALQIHVVCQLYITSTKLFKERKIRGEKNEGAWQAYDYSRTLGEALKWGHKILWAHEEEERASFPNWGDQERVLETGV